MTLVVFSAYGLGCSCAPPPVSSKDVEEIRAEKRRYFQTEFSGAAFIGKIVKRERANVNWMARTMAGEPTVSQLYRYTIRVKEYWLGVKAPTMVVYGEPSIQIFDDSMSGSSCGFKLEKGKTYFFTPDLYQNNLQIGLCDFAGGGSDPVDGPVAEFRRIMGEPKRF